MGEDSGFSHTRKYLKVEQISELYTVRDGKSFQGHSVQCPDRTDVETRHRGASSSASAETQESPAHGHQTSRLQSLGVNPGLWLLVPCPLWDTLPHSTLLPSPRWLDLGPGGPPAAQTHRMPMGFTGSASYFKRIVTTKGT